MQRNATPIFCHQHREQEEASDLVHHEHSVPHNQHQHHQEQASDLVHHEHSVPHNVSPPPVIRQVFAVM